MNSLRRFFDNLEEHFAGDGGKYRKFQPLYKALDNFFFSSPDRTVAAPHVRDGMDLQRMMVFVVFALIPPTCMAFFNTGLQANIGLQQLGIMHAPGWRGEFLEYLGLEINPHSITANIVHGGLFFLPVYLLTLVVGGFWEVLFAVIRKDSVKEAFMVTSLLFALILPPNIPWWQVMLGISFGIVFGKEIFGGVGMNILNPALTGRAFLFFAYPGQITGDHVWVAVDGISRATPLAELSTQAVEFSYSMKDVFWGTIPGSMGETSTLACLLGAAFLIITQVASWRIMLGVVLGMVSLSLLFNLIGSDTNPMFAVTPLQHFVLGGFAFGMTYMATDPVSAAHSQPGRWVYGILIGSLTVLIRVINPGFPEGIMLAILFSNVFAPIIDRFFINRNVKRRELRYATD